MFPLPVKCVGFPHVWLRWHGNRNGIVMCVLNFSPLSPEFRAEESLTPTSPHLLYQRGGRGKIFPDLSQHMYQKKLPNLFDPVKRDHTICKINERPLPQAPHFMSSGLAGQHCSAVKFLVHLVL